MTGDNSTATKMNRAYERLITAILENRPTEIVELLVFEYATSGSSVLEFEENRRKAFQHAMDDATNYFLHYQAGRTKPIRKDSPLGRKLSKGMFSPSNEEA